MAKWITKPCEELLKQINDVPYDDQREARQMTLLMAGISSITREMMLRAAQATREGLGETAKTSAAPASSSETPSQTNPQTPSVSEPTAEPEEMLDLEGFDDELDMIEKTLIRSIGD